MAGRGFGPRVIGETLGDMRGRALSVVLGCLICQMGLGFGYVFAPLAKDIIDELGWTRAMFSFTRVPQLAVMALASPLVGTLTIRYGARRVLLSSIGLLGACLIALSEIRGLYPYYALLMLLGLGLTGVGDITVGQTVSQWVQRGRGLALGLVFIGSNLGGLLLVPLAVSIAERSSWRWSLAALGLLAICVMLPIALLLVRDHHVRIETTDLAPEQAAEAARRLGAHDLDLRQALGTRSFWILFFSLFSFFFYFLSLLEHLVLFLTDEGMARVEAVEKYAVAIGLGIWSKLGLGLIADRIAEKRALLIDYGVLALSSFTLLTLPDSGLIWIFVVGFGFSYAARDVVYPLIVTRCFGLRYMAQIYGALMITLVLGASGPFFAAAVHDHTGSYMAAFRLFAVLNVIATLSLLLLRDERPAAAAG